MRLKRLEMIGFKSFAQKTLVELNPGITAVVGPNGCGKSNIVDALRWAMGEQSARHLRGQQMEDVVFNGSDSLPATGMAEVSLTFDNEDGRGPADYASFSEISITRRLFRSGESEYAINKTPCRLKDIVELFLGTGIGSKAYSIVEQGRVDELVNSKPEDRRALIEEAAGTSKYKSRKLVAERKLERTQQNLLRVTDIVREIERQIRSMELQARKAERYRALRAELKEKDLAHAALQKQAFDHDLDAHEKQLADTENRLAAHIAGLRAKEAQSESVRLSMMEADREIGAQQETVYQHKVEIQSEEQRIDFAKRDLAQLDKTENESRAALLQLESKLHSLTQEIDELSAAKESFVQLSLFEASFLRDKEEQLAQIQNELRGIGAEIECEKEALIETANQIAYLKNDLLTKERRRGELRGEQARSQDEHETAKAAAQQCAQKRTDSKQALELCLDQACERALEAAQLSASMRSLGDERADRERKITALKGQCQESRSRLISLEDLQKNYEGYQEGVRAIMLKKQQESGANGIYGLVAEVIEAPESYEKALTAVLGDRLQYVIVKGHEEGLEAIEYLKQQASGRSSFIPLHLSRKPHKPLPIGETEVVAPLMDMVSVKDGYRDIAEYLLSDVVVVHDLISGLALWNRNGFYCTLVTADGEVVDPMGIVTGGSGASLEGSVLAQRRRIRELKTLLADLDVRLEAETQKHDTISEQLGEAETQHALLSAAIHRLDLDRVRLEHENRSAEEEFARLALSLRALAQEQSEVNAHLELLSDEIYQAQSTSERLLMEKNERQLALVDKQANCDSLKQSAEALEADVTQSRIRNAALGEKRENTRHNLDNRLLLREETVAQIETRQAQIGDVLTRRSEIESSLADALQMLTAHRANLQALEERLHADRQTYRNISMSLAEIDEAIRELRPLSESCQDDRNRLQLQLAEMRLNYQHLADNLREKYDTDLTLLPACAPEDAPSQGDLLAEIEDLRGRLERMGEVNLAAIGEYEELTARCQFMSQQKEDLEKSMADLQQTIIKLNRVCRLRFKESFEEINQQFEIIFPRLFHGGKAKLVLTDDNDYLETGVDIVVQPPGKKLQSITLLSGGEKALTAVSLLFAIFLTKPSPFCFLDEVDAPLDDANIERFNDMIKEMSEHSQFVLVTHNKKSMQAAEILYGITMAEPGVSKVVSVRMQ